MWVSIIYSGGFRGNWLVGLQMFLSRNYLVCTPHTLRMIVRVFIISQHALYELHVADLLHRPTYRVWNKIHVSGSSQDRNVQGLGHIGYIMTNPRVKRMTAYSSEPFVYFSGVLRLSKTVIALLSSWSFSLARASRRPESFSMRLICTEKNRLSRNLVDNLHTKSKSQAIWSKIQLQIYSNTGKFTSQTAPNHTFCSFKLAVLE